MTDSVSGATKERPGGPFTMQGLIVASLAAYAIAGLASIVIIALRGQDPPAELTTTMATAVGALGGRLTK